MNRFCHLPFSSPPRRWPILGRWVRFRLLLFIYSGRAEQATGGRRQAGQAAGRGPLPKSPDPVNAPADRYESFLSSSDPRPMGAVSTSLLFTYMYSGRADEQATGGKRQAGQAAGSVFAPLSFFAPLSRPTTSTLSDRDNTYMFFSSR